MSWTDERVELLRKLWNEGLSASQVAAELGTGVTRNAVIGKIHRLGLAERAKTPSAPRPRAAKAPRSQQPAARTSSHSVMGNVALALSPRLIVAAAPRIEEDVVVPMSARVTLWSCASPCADGPWAIRPPRNFAFAGPDLQGAPVPIAIITRASPINPRRIGVDANKCG